MAYKSLTKTYDVISVSHFFYPRVGGLEKMAYTVLSSLASQGYKSLAVHGNGTTSYYHLNDFDCQSFYTYKVMNKSYPVFGLKFALYMIRLLKRNPQAVVLVYDRHLTSSFVTALVCKLMNRRYVLIHQTTNSSYFRQKAFELLANFLDKYVFKYVVKWADHNISVSEATKAYMMENYHVSSDKFTTIHNGFNEELLAKFPVDIAAKKKQVIFAAKWIQVKDPDSVAKAYLSLAEKHPDWEFIIAGEGDCMLTQMDKLPENLDLIPRFLTQLELFEAFSKSAIYINASINEGLAISIVEAAAMGNMLVLSDAPSNVELNSALGLSGNIFERGNWQALADKIEAAITMFNSAEHQTQIVKTMEVAQAKFTNKSVLQKYANFIAGYSSQLSQPTILTNAAGNVLK